ncbi:uncharacterized protein ARMOST_17804 [Armillaria ostoyae]|uniref:Uncharacterized protein n=1 Tax=Armillaria ostoyae TaxID=47428 RepID=A0A284S000_ARMOS|nr:uncharacterized protein ARMOST_17804 [Armillaria ostoyae]
MLSSSTRKVALLSLPRRLKISLALANVRVNLLTFNPQLCRMEISSPGDGNYLGCDSEFRIGLSVRLRACAHIQAPLVWQTKALPPSFVRFLGAAIPRLCTPTMAAPQSERHLDLVRIADASTCTRWPKRKRGTECRISQAERGPASLIHTFTDSCLVLHCRNFLRRTSHHQTPLVSPFSPLHRRGPMFPDSASQIPATSAMFGEEDCTQAGTGHKALR